MRTFFIVLLCFSASNLSSAQETGYKFYKIKADSLFNVGEYRASAEVFSKAFESLNWRGYMDDRFTAARAWAKIGNADSAVFQLHKILTKSNFLDNKKGWETMPEFSVIQHELAWQELMTQWQKKLDNLENARSNPLSIQLEKIHFLDQYYRVKKDSVLQFHNMDSPEMNDWLRRWVIQDSLNYIVVNDLLETYGWPGTDEITDKASTAIWLVLQHADRNLKGQEKWLPVMREAVAAGKAKASNLAYLEDRVLKNQGKPQRFGSQLQTDPDTGALTLYPVEDPANLDARRKTMELGPIQDYLNQTGAIWKQ